MRRLSLLSFTFIVCVGILLAGCQDNHVVQDNAPPPNDQTPVPFTTQQLQTAEDTTDIIPGQYIVVFKDQAGGIISEQAAQVAEERTNSILADHSISADSVAIPVQICPQRVFG